MDSPWVREAEAEEALRVAAIKHSKAMLEAEAAVARAEQELIQARAQARTNHKEDD